MLYSGRNYFQLNKTNKINRRIVLPWIPAQVEVKGNEVANDCAKARTKEGENKELKVPYLNLTGEYKMEAILETQDSRIGERSSERKLIFKIFIKNVILYYN